MANNLIELCQRLRAETPSMSTEQSFELLKSLIGDDIYMRYEIVRADAGTVDTRVDTEPTENIVEGDVGDANSTTRGKYAHLNDLTISRVLLTTIRSQKTDYSRELVRQCNGVVLEYPTWKILALPSHTFNPNFNIGDVKKNIAQYRIYEIKDGSTVTLYWYGNTLTDGSWCMSSANGFDVSGYQWLGQSTYMMAFNQLARSYPDFSFDRLDKTKSYTVGFHHADFHPLMADPSKIWLIQASDLTTLCSCNVNIGIPFQTTIENSDWDRMIEKNNNAMTKYMSYEHEIHYGYILRRDGGGDDDGNGCDNNIILESELLKKIRLMVYNLPKKRIPGAAPITPDTRIGYIVLRAYLNAQRYVFINLFPQYNNLYKKYDDMFAKLANRIIMMLRKNRPIRIETLADQLAVNLTDHIRRSGINVLNPDGEGIILDFLRDKNNLDLYYSFLVAPISTSAQVSRETHS